MYYSDELIEEVRSRNPIQDVVGSYVHLTKKGGNYFGLCPFHNEKTGSFSVSPSKQIYHCFGCGAGGNVITFIMNYENASFQEAMDILAARAGIELPKQEFTPKQKQEADLKTQLLEIHKEAAIYYHKILRSEQGKQGLKYFRSRGLSDPTMVSFGLGYTGQHSDGLYRFMKEKGYSDLVLKETGLFTINEKGGRDKFWNRVMFPIMDSGNRVIGFGGRLMGQGEPKYLNSPETKIFEKGKNLYALNVAKRSKEPYFLIMEGYMDVISVHQAGFPNAVAALGTAFTPRHAAIIKRYKEEAVLCFDMDDAGRKAALRAIPILRAEGLRLKVISLVPYKDPDEFIQNLGTDEFRKRIESAENAFLFEVRMEREKFDFADPAEKTLFFNRAAKMLAAFREEIERNSYIEAVSKQYGIDYAVLKKRVEEIGNRALNENPDEYAPETKRAVKPAGKDREAGLKEAEKLVLTELVDRPERFQEIRKKLSPEDFRPGVARSVATLLFEQLSRGREALNPAAIMDRFLNDDAYNEVAAFFTSTYSERLSAEERDRALSEAVKKLRLEALEEKIRETTDPQVLMDLLKQKDALR